MTDPTSSTPSSTGNGGPSATITTGNQVPPDYDSGVTNGDVDWLFRGKSKKLTKKLNNANIDKERRSSVISRETESKDKTTLNSTKSTPVNEPIKENPAENDEKVEKNDQEISNSGSNLPEKTSKEANETTEKQTTPVVVPKSKLGRIRSSSTSLLGTLNPESSLPRRRGSTSSAASGSSVSSSCDTDESSATKPGSGGKTRSLFSSFSLKFKSSTPSLSTSPKNNIAPVSAHNSYSLTGMPSVSSTPSAKINTNLIGSLSTHDALASLTKDDRSRRSLVSRTESPSSSFEKEKGRFFRRRLSQSTLADRDTIRESVKPRVVLNKDPNRKPPPLPELSQLSTKRVNFAIDKLPNDPQQQIPSRRPRKGNVLIPEELTAPPPKLSQGISTMDGTKSTIKKPYSERELQLAIEAQKKALIESEKHGQEAYLAAKKIANEVAHFGRRMDGTTLVAESDDEEDDVMETSSTVENDIEIDKPLHVHENHFEPEEDAPDGQDEELSLETVYTRCCHLREILPIPATLKQLKNKSRPLQVLKLLNPKPTLIDVLSFSDFIAITPINTVIFDNVSMTTEMLKHFLSSLVYNKSLEKLSLRNVAIDDLGWKYLCDFLSRNQTVKKLDISQQKVKPDTPSNAIRSNMNWNLFIKSLVIRGGLEELVLNGCKLSDQQFTRLMKEAIVTSTRRLGLASVELNKYKAQLVSDWISQPDSLCMGVDVAFNDLSHGQLDPFINAFSKGNRNLRYFSLNSTKLNDVNEFSRLLEALIHIETLRFLDLSSLPDLFPGIIPRLNTYLPQFPNLKRIHFDLNELSAQAISAIADIIAKVDGLVHVSFLGNRNLEGEAMASLYSAVKVSKSLFTLDIDYDLVSDDFSQRLAFYLTRNMSRAMNVEYHLPTEEQEELMFDGSLLMETAERLLVENEKGIEKKEDLKLKKIVADALIERTEALRKDIHTTIDRLFEKRNNNQLSFEGKENLIRFCLLDASLEKVVHLFEEQSSKYGTPMSPSPSITLNHADKQEENRTSSMHQNFHDMLHESSSELITAGPILSPRNVVGETSGGYFGGEQSLQPHQVVLESSSDGRNVPIDNLTGRPVLMKSISQTSLHAKEQEQEEGEFHRLGYFMQRHSNDEKKEKPTLNALPSGSELRDAILTAKGIESVTDLIDNINNQRVSIDKIYEVKKKPEKNEEVTEDPDEIASIDSEKSQGAEVNAVVDQVYDRLLNDAQRVRSNKQE